MKKPILKKLLIFFVVQFICVSLTYSQQYDFVWHTTKEGLPRSVVYDIFQDSRGFMWFGTEDGGVCRYDGEIYKTYTTENGLADNTVRKIFEDSNGNLLFGCEKGLSIFDGKTFSSFSQKDGISDAVVSIKQDSDNSYWIGTSGGGLLKVTMIAKDSILIKKYTTSNGLTNNVVFDIFKDSYNRLWLATLGGGITIIKIENDSIVKTTSLRKLINYPSDLITGFYPEDINTLWCNTYDNGIFKIKIQEDLNKIMSEVFPELSNMKDLRCWGLTTSNNKTYIATDARGITILSKGKIESIMAKNGLRNNQIIKVLKDAHDNIWFSVYGEGVCILKNEHIKMLTKADGLINDNIRYIKKIDSKRIYLATDGSGIQEITKTENGFLMKKIDVQKGLISDFVNHIAVDKDKNIWIATSHGVSILNNGQFINLTKNDGLPENQVNVICPSKSGDIWFGTSNGISKLSERGFFTIDSKYGLPNNYVNDLLEDRFGNIWSATQGGLARIHGGEITTYDQKEGLNYPEINCITEDPKGNIWIGTSGGGIYMYEIAGDTIYKNVPNTALLSINIMSVFFENDSRVWVTTDKGVSLLVFENQMLKSIKNYTGNNGFKSTENNINSVAQIDGELWFGTTDGIIQLDQQKETVESNLPGIFIRNIKLNFENTNWSEYSSQTNSWTNIPDQLTLGYFNNNLSFEFGGIFYKDQEQILYTHILEGLEKKWSPPRKETEAIYQSLPPGEYTFRVKAIIGDGKESIQEAVFSFTIAPPFWRTLWFYSLVLIIIVAIVIIYIKQREKKLIKEKQILEAEVEKRTAEVVRQKAEIEEKNTEITDSIRYAKRIQEAVLPYVVEIESRVSDIFILYKPRDIVSGDFYWMTIKNDIIVLTDADCTGHGVPGAFMSMLGMSFLNQIVNNRGITHSDEILNQLRQNIIEALNQKSQHSEQKDGMDMAICCIDLNKMIVEYSGANNQLIIIRDEEIIEIKADKMPVAIYEKLDPFTLNEIPVFKGDRLYMFSDGYTDQFGGPKGKKFMTKQLKQTLLDIHKEPMHKQKDLLDLKIEEWKSYTNEFGHNFEQIDDISILGITI